MNRTRTVAAALLFAAACGDNPLATRPVSSDTPTPYPHPDPVLVEYSATPSVITRGQRSTLRWRGEGFGVVYIEGTVDPFPLLGSLVVSPAETTTYVLVTNGLHGGGSLYRLTVEVTPAL